MAERPEFRKALAAVRAAFARAFALRAPLLIIHVALVVASAAAVAPLTALALRVAVALSGKPALADQEIARYLFSPVGLIAGVAAASLLIAAGVLELAMMAALDLARRRGEEAGLRAAACFAFRRAPRLFRYAAHLVIRLLLIAAPFALAALLVARLLLSEADVNYYLTARPPEALLAAALLGIIALGFAAALLRAASGWAMSGPAALFADVSPRAAFAHSVDLMTGRRRAFALKAALFAAAAIGLGAAILASAGAAARLLLGAAGSDLHAMSGVLVGSLALWLAANAVATAFATGALAALLLDEAADAGLKLGESARAGDTPEALRRRKMAVALLALCGLAGLGAVTGASALVDDLVEDRAIEIIAHRGAANARPENTLAAFERAIEDGADWIELDVQESAEGDVVVIHDSDFMKLAGDPLKVRDATRADLARLDVGSSFDPAYADQRAPLLSEALALAKGRAKVLIELKHYGFAVRLEERVVSIVEALEMQDQIAVMSLELSSAQKMKALRPDWRVGALAAAAIGDMTALGLDFLAVNIATARRSFMDRAEAAAAPVLVWTVDSPLEMNRMAALGVAGLITNEPALAREVLADRAEMGGAERILLSAAALFDLPVAPRRARVGSP